MKIIIINFFVFSVLLLTGQLFSQSGEDLFKSKCSACHTVGKGKLVGPDLAGVKSRKDEQWLIKFITSSQTVINSGDEYAKKKFEEFNKVIMPDPGISETEIKSILAYIETQGGTPTTQTVSTFRPLSESNSGNIESGRKLFSGEQRFTHGGTSCISCHNVPDVTYFGGGRLAVDLTNVYSRLGEAALVNIIQTQPFPVMKQAFVNNPLTESEVYDLASYLKDVDEKQKFALHANPTINFLYSGIAGLAVLLVVFTGFWHKRRKGSVNNKIYKRQEDFLNKNSN
ncbi:MAG: c-type cytochrome [Ignavibacteria bacterium]|nr:c-type cytochrome [Ignavibacteria bacterium]